MTDEHTRILNGTEYNVYKRLHVRLNKKYGKAPFCIFNQDHKSKHYEWANVTQFVTDDIEDYLPMCISCHRKFDITDSGRRGTSRGNLGNKNARRTPISCFIKNTVIESFESTRDAENKMGILHTSIANCLSGRTRTAGGFIWKRI